MMQAAIYEKRIKALQNRIKKDGVSALIIDSVVDIFYLTGFNVSVGRLIVCKNKTALFVDGRYIQMCQKAPCFVFLNTQDAQKDFLKRCKNLETLAFDGLKTHYSEYLKIKALKKGLSKYLHSQSRLQLTSLEDPLKEFRSIKSKEELAILKKAARLGSLGFDFVCKNLKEGITEKQLCDHLEVFWKQQGGQKLAFEPIIAFGKNTSMPHYHPTGKKLKKYEAVLIDIGVVLGHYHSDMTRVVFFQRANEKMQELYSIVLQAQKMAIGALKEGVSIKEIDSIARAYISKKGYGKYFCHGLGHGLGLEIHEYPYINSKSKDILKEGMVITIEPGIYIPNVGGVRIEDTLVITKKGSENLTKRPKNLLVVS